MKIDVRKSHIANGVQKNSHACMIADAIKDKHPEARWIMVDLQSIRWTVPATRKRYTYMTPAAAQSALIRFDRGDTSIQPFSFTLHGPTVRNTGWLGQRRSPHAVKPKNSAKHKAKYAYLAANRARLSEHREFGLRKFA